MVIVELPEITEQLKPEEKTEEKKVEPVKAEIKQEEKKPETLNQIAVRWPAKAVAQFSFF